MIVHSKTMETYKLVVDLMKSGASPIEIGNAIRAGASGDVASPLITALSHLETLASLAKKTLPGIGGGLAAADLGNNVRKAMDENDRYGYVTDNTLLAVASNLTGLVAVVGSAMTVGTVAAPALLIAGTAASIGFGVAALFSDIGDDSKTEIVDAISEAMAGIAQFGGDIKEWLVQIGDDFADGVNRMMDALADLVDSGWDFAADTLGNLLGGKALSDLIDSLKDQFTTAATVAPPRVDPLILDLDGDGLETTSVAAGTHFDLDKNGFAERTGWVGADDGLLVLDRNGDGIINNGGELFGDQTVLKNGLLAANGFQALVMYNGINDMKWRFAA